MKTHYYDIIKKPLMTEKTTALTEQNKFIFHVAEVANKSLIKEAIEKIFNVKVLKVNIVNLKGKVKRFKGRLGKQQDKKKALVTLEKDYTIDLTGGIR